MIKLTFCLFRRPHLTREAFQDYWLNTHGPLVRSFQVVLRIERYVQTHSFDEAVSAGMRGAREGPPQYDGVAELWWDSFEAMAKPGDEEAARAGRLLLEDEKTFIDLSRSPLWWGEEKPIIG